MLGPVDISGYYRDCYGQGRKEMIDWVICGGETGPGAREMKAAWAFDLYEQCLETDVPFFFKKQGDAFKGLEINLPHARQWPKEQR
jgi:protein gp37